MLFWNTKYGLQWLFLYFWTCKMKYILVFHFIYADVMQCLYLVFMYNHSYLGTSSLGVLLWSVYLKLISTPSDQASQRDEWKLIYSEK